MAASTGRNKILFVESESEEMIYEVDEAEIKDGVEDSEPCLQEDEVDVDEEEYMEEDEEEEEEDSESDQDDDEDGQHEEATHEQASAVAAAQPDVRASTRTSRTAVANVTVCDADALECGVCFLPLKPPIFQCELGHVVCTTCRDKLDATGNGKCHVCGVATRGYRRCHAMEHLLDCIRVPCPYSTHGCDATPSYHSQESHRQACQHAPCHCPGDSCAFIGSTTALLDHFASAHNWPCTTKVKAGEMSSICLRDGFNFFLLENPVNCGGQPAASCSVRRCRLFLLNVTRERHGRAVSVLCIHPSHASSAAAAANGGARRLLPSTQCELVFSRYGDGSSCRSHYQASVFDVVCTDLSKGLPDPEGCFQFLVPNAVFGVRDDKNSILVKARIIIN